MRFGAVIVETRNLPYLTEVINNHLKFLPNDWGLTIYHSLLNEKELKTNFPKARFINLNVETINWTYYNNLLTSISFWNEIPYDKVLIFQSDSMLLREGIKEFIKDGADYYGSPWSFQFSGGNGGLSLRTKKVMIDVINKFPFNKAQHGNEDVYFSNHIEKVGGKLGTRDLCSQFACETIFKLGTLGVHAVNRWLSKEECDQIMNQYNG